MSSGLVRTPSAMTTSLQVGDFTYTIAEVLNADRSPNASPLTVSPGSDTRLRVRVNPSNPRQVGVLALAPGSVNVAVQVSVGFNTYNKDELFTIELSAPSQEGLTLGEWAPVSTTAPTWMTDEIPF